MQIKADDEVTLEDIIEQALIQYNKTKEDVYDVLMRNMPGEFVILFKDSTYMTLSFAEGNGREN